MNTKSHIQDNTINIIVNCVLLIFVLSFQGCATVHHYATSGFTTTNIPVSITSIDKTVCILTKTNAITSDLQNYFIKKGWTLSTADKANFRVEYAITDSQRKDIVFGELYNGYISISHNEKIVVSLKFLERTESKIFEVFTEELEKNIVIK